MRRSTGVVAAGCLLALVVAAIVSRGHQDYPGRLDPQNPGPGGGQALARVLADQGVEVQVVRNRHELDAAPTEDTVVVVTSPGQLGRSTVDQLRALPDGETVLVVDPGPEVLDLFDAGTAAARTGLDHPVAARCDRFDGLSIDVADARAYHASGESCFPVEAGALLTRPHTDLTVLGAGTLLSNGRILRGDNAAVALRLLGASRHLVWYVPTTADLAAGDEVGLGRLLPTWLLPGLWVVGFAAIGLLLWRGRRLGRLATEPLPVTVRAIETTQSRGRLYRKANDRPHAATALRRAARVRLTERLGLPHDAPEGELVSSLARATATEPSDLRDLLYGAAPVGDRALIRLATRLADLDDQLRKAPQ